MQLHTRGTVKGSSPHSKTFWTRHRVSWLRHGTRKLQTCTTSSCLSSPSRTRSSTPPRNLPRPSRRSQGAARRRQRQRVISRSRRASSRRTPRPWPSCTMTAWPRPRITRQRRRTEPWSSRPSPRPGRSSRSRPAPQRSSPTARVRSPSCSSPEQALRQASAPPASRPCASSVSSPARSTRPRWRSWPHAWRQPRMWAKVEVRTPSQK
mmetsp:Transcript_98020/g.285916  ORF Transcript_98020/g.285916 Transcript_98020/m.285916 type:complete len:208 (+) Transcript_98020:686-1309(+)